MLGRMKIGTKILAGFGIAIAVSLMVGAVGYFSLHSVETKMDTVTTISVPSLVNLQNITESQKSIWVAERGLIIRQFMEPKVRQAQYDYADKAWARIDEAWQAFEAIPMHSEDRAAWNTFKPLWEEWKQAQIEVVRISREKDRLVGAGVSVNDSRVTALDASAVEASLAARPYFLKAETALNNLIELTKNDVDASNAETAKTARAANATLITALIIGAFLLMGLALVLTRAIGSILRTLVAESKRLSDAAMSGKLGVRGDVQLVNFEFRPIIEGLNATLDAVISPLKMAAGYVDRISKGDIPEKITDEYQGDFNEIKNNLNQCIDAVSRLVTDANTLAEATEQGLLNTRADASRHLGDFRRVVDGLNQTVTTLTGFIDSMPNPTMVIDKDFTIRYMNDIGARVGGMTKDQVIGQKCHDYFRTSDCRTSRCACAQAMSQGREASSDTDAHPGNLNLEIHYSGLPLRDRAGKVIGAFEVVTDQTEIRLAGRKMQKVADYQTAETRKLTSALAQMAGGDLSAQIDLAPGDEDTVAAREMLQQILTAMHAFKQAVVRLVDDANLLATAAVEGRLDTRSDVTQHQGDFRKIVAGVNATLDAVLNPIKEASAVLETLSNYDLRARMQGEYHGDHAKIKESLNRTAQALHDSLAQVAEAVEQVTSASGQIASSSQQVAEGASEQASSLEETSSSLEEMSSMTKQNAENTQQAKVLTEATKAAADRGAGSMGQMMDAMGKIRSASEGTAQIIRDINEIAFQTNLLALNAAVEAARAGEAGRGFAVVAEEVRNLAQRAKEAAKKTEDLIHESVTLAESGEKLSREVGGNLDEILTSVSKVAEIVNEVTTASREQSKGIDQVNSAVADMDKVVQSAAANAEESSSAAQELAGQAQELAGMVGRFQLNVNRPAGTGGGAVRRPAAPVAKRKPQALKRPPTSRSGGDWQLDPSQVIPLEDETELATF